MGHEAVHECFEVLPSFALHVAGVRVGQIVQIVRRPEGEDIVSRFGQCVELRPDCGLGMNLIVGRELEDGLLERELRLRRASSLSA